MTATATERPLVFDHVNLKEVDPSVQTLPEGVTFNWQIFHAELKSFTYKSGENEGQEGQYIRINAAITDDPEFRGRRTYNTIFPDSKAMKQLRLLMDATGIPQGDTQPLEEWVKSLEEQKATFSAPTKLASEKDQSGQARTVSKVNFWKVQPAN